MRRWNSMSNDDRSAIGEEPKQKNFKVNKAPGNGLARKSEGMRLPRTASVQPRAFSWRWPETTSPTPEIHTNTRTNKQSKIPRRAILKTGCARDTCYACCQGI